MVSSKDFTAGEKKKCMKTSVEKLKKRRRRRSVSFPGTEVVGERVSLAWLSVVLKVRTRRQTTKLYSILENLL